MSSELGFHGLNIQCRVFAVAALVLTVALQFAYRENHACVLLMEHSSAPNVPLFPGVDAQHELESNLEYSTWRHRFGQYPISLKDMREAFYFNENYKALEALRNMSKSGSAPILVVGGSETAGHECKPSQGSVANKQCAWTRYFLDWLKYAYPNVTWTLDNLAEGGTGIDVWYHRLSKEYVSKYKLMIVDTTVNSQDKSPQEIKSILDSFLLKFNDIPKISLSLFRTCNYTASDCNIHCSFFEQGRLQDGYSWCYKWWRIQDYELDIYTYYNVSVMSFRDAIWSNLARPPESLPGIWNGLSHPDYVGHQLIANMVQHSWNILTAKAQKIQGVYDSYEAKPYFEFTRTPECSSIKQVFLDHNGCVLNDTQVDGFICKEDVPGKGGWISEYTPVSMQNGESLHTVSITVHNTIHALLIEYLESWDAVGVLDIHTDSSPEVVFSIDAKSNKHYSVSKIVTVDLSTHGQHVSLQHAFAADRPKFKIMTITGC